MGCTFLGYYSASSCNFLLTFWETYRSHLQDRTDRLSQNVDEPIGCPEKSVRHYHYSLHNNPEELSSQNINNLFEMELHNYYNYEVITYKCT